MLGRWCQWGKTLAGTLLIWPLTGCCPWENHLTLPTLQKRIPSASTVIFLQQGLGLLFLNVPSLLSKPCDLFCPHIGTVTLLISRFQSLQTTELLCRFEKTEGFPFSLPRVLTEGSHTPTRGKWKQEESWKSGTRLQAKKKRRVGIFKTLSTPRATPLCLLHGSLPPFSSTMHYFRVLLAFGTAMQWERQFNCHRSFS